MNKKEYYEKAELWLATNSKWRIFKFILEDRRVIRLYIRDKDKLRQYLLKYLPKHVYYSVSCFSNPKEARCKDEPRIYRRNVIESNIPFDVDFHDGNFEKAKKNTISLIKFMENKKDYKLNYILFSGRGFQVVYDYKLKAIAKPRERENYLKEERVKLVSEIKNKRILIDEEITLDLNRVVRLPNTIHGKIGLKAKIINNMNDLSSFTVPKRRIVDDRTNKLVVQPFQNDVEPERKGTSSLYFISNEIYGMNRFCMFLVYNNLTLKQVEKDLKNLQETYNLGDIHIFQRENDYYAVCLQTFQQRRLQKIVKQSKSVPLQLKYGRSWLKMKFSYVKTIENTNNTFVSRPHMLFLNKTFDLNLDYPKSHGERIAIFNAEVKK